MPTKTSETPKVSREAAIAEIMNGETGVYVRAGVELGYDAGYRAAIEDAAKKLEEAENEFFDFSGVAAEIRKLGAEK